MWKWKWILAILQDERGEEPNPAEPTVPVEPTEPAEPAEPTEPTEPVTPKFGEFGDDPNEAATKLFEAFTKQKGDFDNFKTKSGLTERNLGTLRKTLEASGIRAVEDENGQIRLEVAKPTERKLRFTDEHKAMFDGKVLEAMRLLVQDIFDESYEGRERTTQEQRQKMQQFMSEKAEVEELMVSYFPQLEGKFDVNGKSQNPQFNQAFYDRATEIWEQDYNKNPLKQLSAALRAAKELNIIPQMIAEAKKAGVEVGKASKRILAPVSGGGAGAGGGGMRHLTKAEYEALSPEDKEKYNQWEIEQRGKK